MDDLKDLVFSPAGLFAFLILTMAIVFGVEGYQHYPMKYLSSEKHKATIDEVSYQYKGQQLRVYAGDLSTSGPISYSRLIGSVSDCRDYLRENVVDKVQVDYTIEYWVARNGDTVTKTLHNLEGDVIALCNKQEK